jgi:membrane-bound serine protease (ClpP class)
MSLRRVLLAAAAASAAALIVAGLARGAEPGSGRVLAVTFSGSVNPVTQAYLTGAIERGEREGYRAVVLLVDTPGGLDSSMRAIVKKELAATVPVVVYVSPPGARAASAGVFLAMAADVTAMAPQTNLGSSTPVSLGGQGLSGDLRRKVVNDAAAYLRGLAEEHGRNGDWAESAVRRGANLPAREALARGVVDAVAPDLPELLEQIDGTKTVPKGLVLDTAGAEIDTLEMSTWQRVLDTLIDPNIVVLLLSLGALGLLIELAHPGLVLPGATGAISLLVGLFGLQVLPVSWAGILLLLLAAGFFGAELVTGGTGALALAGAASFAVGALMLFEPAGDAFHVALPVAIGVAAALAAVSALAGVKIVRARRAAPVSGVEQLVGRTARVRSALDPEGLVFVEGELWQARSTGPPAPAGAVVVVERVGDDLVLDVAPLPARRSPPSHVPIERSAS